jgi:hypothetical protein
MKRKKKKMKITKVLVRLVEDTNENEGVYHGKENNELEISEEDKNSESDHHSKESENESNSDDFDMEMDADVGVVLSLGLLEGDIPQFLSQQKEHDLQNLILFYKTGKAMCTNRKAFTPIKLVKTGGEQSPVLVQIVPSRLTLLSGTDTLRSLHKSWERLMLRVRSTQQATMRKIRVGPITQEDDVGESTIVFRDFRNLLDDWVNDGNYQRLGHYARSPVTKKATIYSGSYSESAQFKIIYDSTLKKYPDGNFFLFAMSIWSDGISMFTHRTSNGDAHPVMLASNLGCELQNAVTKIFGFINIKDTIQTSNSAPLLRAQIFNRSMSVLINEITSICDNGGIMMKVWNKQTRVLPFLSCYLGDLPEQRRAIPSLFCPFCGMTSKGEKSSTLSIKKVLKVEKQQEEAHFQIQRRSLQHTRGFAKNMKDLDTNLLQILETF